MKPTFTNSWRFANLTQQCMKDHFNFQEIYMWGVNPFSLKKMFPLSPPRTNWAMRLGVPTYRTAPEETLTSAPVWFMLKPSCCTKRINPDSTLHTPHSTLSTPQSTLYTLHSTLHTLHFTLYTLHSTLHTLHSSHHTLHSTLYTPRSRVYTPHSTLYTLHSTRYTLHSTLYTPHFTLYTPHSTVYTPQFTLYTPHSTLYTPHSTLYTPHSTLYTLHSTRYTLHCPLLTSHFTLHTSHSTLYTLHSTVYTPHFTLYTPHFTLYSVHSSLHTLQSSLHTLHSTLYTLHSDSLHSTLYTLHSTLYSLHSAFYTSLFPLHASHSILYIPRFTLCTPHSTLYTLDVQDCVNKLCQKSVLHHCSSMRFDIITINIRVNIRVRGLHLVFKLPTSKTKQFCQTFFKNGKLSAELTASYHCILQVFQSICLKYGACHEKVMPGHTKCCTCHAKSSQQTNLKIWCSKMQPLSGNQRPDLLTALMNISLVLRLPREIDLCRSSSNVPRLPLFLEMLQNPHVLLTFNTVHNPLRLPRETTLQSPKVARACCAFNILSFWLRNALRTTTTCTFSTSQLPKVVWTCTF